MENKLKFIDFCAGIGGGRLGIESTGAKCVGYAEIDKDATNTYKLFYGIEENNFGNVMDIIPNNLPNFDLMIGGFPCQSYSIVGLRKGLNDENGKTINGLINILKIKQPKYFILENVKGLISIDNGNSLKLILSELNKVNYNVSWKLLDSINFGTAQMRERVYFVGVRKDLNNNFDWNNIDYSTNEIDLSNFLIDDGVILNHKTDKTFQKYLNNKYNIGKYDITEILKENYTVIDTRQSDLRIYKNKVPTLRAGRHGILYTKNGKLNKLSSLEALLLQGFPYELALIGKNTFSETKLLKQAGNAMTVNVIQAIANELLGDKNENERYGQIRLANC